MRVMVIGSGGREHALAWKIAQSPLVTALFVAPGNGGTEAIATNVAVDITDHAAVIAAARAHEIDFVVVGPDAQVVAGLGDDVRAAGFTCFCPSKAAGQLEGSKSFTKALCDQFNIPTAAYGRFEDEASALAYLYVHGAPIVIKADGLAAGKGVTVAMSVEEAEEAIIDCFSGAFGASGAAVVIEEFMEGEEVSLFVLTDGTAVLPLTTAQDHKRAFDGDTGPNTGGMGAYSPAPVMSEEVYRRSMDEIVLPTVRGMAQRGTPYAGVLYAGLMLTEDGPKLVEYNARFGDPETQVMMMRMQSDIVPLLHAVATSTLAGHSVEWKDAFALTVILATRGYPGDYGKGSEIGGVDGLDSDTLTVFHAGTKRDGERLLANGGRVLNVTALGASVKEAQERAYHGVDQIDWPEGFARRDIGWREIAREQD
ncbi:phosphoribosylamine--glycine ligase [Devosia sp. 63-57]|uniref:phosphoribosylamine--glycine ligase n=1 Tax=Devosia sp. 63-57 TaxID=1895751 RepID=UPI00086E5BB9|nr:phosphoribosylamine--glycine ligase [Devosia sp. 63-57]ODT47573.1 MAG: phosphoribosylamine--glycine ligase [Pelagibacterium sp. SCN 63-126]ODU86383.1 MAG: phosphoribosylamine--glycine ligase [Pelagibacterium sp. SCN 63-17]OJX42720.1 MAG: phosphoribosylamine--glycine ligase [Devosia sp. 63-57]